MSEHPDNCNIYTGMCDDCRDLRNRAKARGEADAAKRREWLTGYRLFRHLHPTWPSVALEGYSWGWMTGAALRIAHDEGLGVYVTEVA